MTAQEKFKNLTIEEDTKMLSEAFFKLGEYDAKAEIWVWDGITASSIIFYKSDVRNFTEDELVNLIREKIPMGDDYTFTDNGEYIFFNYGFEY